MRAPPLALLLLAAMPALADHDAFDLEYFAVSGATSRELAAQIDAKGPIGDNGLRSDGYTRWTIDWHFDLHSDVTGCSADNIRVDLAIHMILPRWDRPRAADPALVARWNRYLAALRVHEDGHRSRAEAAAGEVRRALRRERGARDCDTLTNRMNSRANALLAELRERQAAYDRETDSGRKQGVIRP